MCLYVSASILASSPYHLADMLDGVSGDGGDNENGGGMESGEEEEMSGGPQHLHVDVHDDDDDSAFKLNTNPALTKALLSTPASSQGLPELTNPSSELTSLGKGQQLALAS